MRHAVVRAPAAILFKRGRKLFQDYRNAALESNDPVVVQLFPRKDTAGYAQASRPAPAIEPDRTVMPPKPEVPGSDAVRSLLILAAESAFDLQNGAKESEFVSQLSVRCKDLEQKLESLSLAGQGADFSLMFRRARQAVATFNATVRSKVLEEIDEDTEIDELHGALQVVKDAAVEAGKALKLIELRAA